METKLQRTREVHDTLLPVMAELVGDQLQVLETENVDAGLIRYGFADHDAFVGIKVVPHSDRAASVALDARMGRCYVGYRRALRWLAANRAGNTVAIDAGMTPINARELRVYTHRVTLPGDADGLRAMMMDFGHEVACVKQGLVWFPQLVTGHDLSEMENIKDNDMKRLFQAILYSPADFCAWVDQNPEEALKRFAHLPIRVFGWLNRWQDNLNWMEKHWATLSDEDQNENQTGYLLERTMTLGRLERFKETLFLLDEIKSEFDDTHQQLLIALRVGALCGLGQHEEALEAVQSAEYDDNSRVWYWRAYAAASMQQGEKALECLANYESQLGVDIIARKKVCDLIQKNENEEAADQPDA